ncbi:hypothetical protein M1D80_08925 [Phyllobacteriaceae bacterium JZ32]
MTNVKLHINITQGIIDAEGAQEFVWRVYEDFRDRLGTQPLPSVTASSPDNTDIEESTPHDTQPTLVEKQRKKPKKKASSSATATNGKDKGSPGITGHKPKLLPDLDTKGIKEFLGQYQLGNNSDIIVAICKFLESKGVSPASVDAFYTCYQDAGLKLPEAFGQAFVNTRGNKKGFINFTTVDDIELTTRGRNHIDHGGIKKIDA